VALSLGEEIATYLQRQSLSTDLNYDGSGDINLFVTQLPDQPDLAVAIIERGGLAPMTTLTGGGAAESRLDRPRIQIRVRSGMGAGQYDAGQSLAQSVYWALQGINETILNPPNGQLFHLIEAVQPPQYLGREIERERNQWSQSFQIWWDNAAT